MIKRLLIFVKRRVVIRLKTVKWNIEAKKLSRYEIVDNAITIHSLIGIEDRVLVVAPHPDDELIGCYGVLERLGKNADVYYTGLTGYDVSDKNKDLRKKELKLLTEKLNNGFYYDKTEEHSIFQRLVNNNYAFIFIPSYIDWHWEHRKTCIEVFKSINKIHTDTKILLYPVTVPIPAKYVTHYSSVHDNKWNTFFEIYKSQSFMPINRFIAVEKSYMVRGLLRIEPYMMVDRKRIDHIMERLEMLNLDELNTFEDEINRLEIIRTHSQILYNMVFDK